MSSANTLTGLIPVIYQGLDTVVRERVGLVSKVTLDASASNAAVNQTVRSFITPASSAVSITPGAYAPDSGGQSLAYNDITISNAQAVPIQWTGEEQRAVGGEYNNMLADQFSQAFRTLTNQVESTLATAAIAGASRAYAFGNATVKPFSTANDLSDSAGVLKILDDNGAPFQDLAYVANNGTMSQFRGKQSVLFKVNEAGTADLLRKGIMGDLQGMAVGQSAQLTLHTNGTDNGSYVLNGAHTVGATTIAVKTGAGTILAGDCVTITSGGVANTYVAATALAAGSFTINLPGLMVAGADSDTVKTFGNYTPNVALNRAGIILLARQPVMPAGGDMAVDVMPITDPVSGITYQVALYRGYRQIHMEVGLAWGAKVVKPQFIALNIGA